MNNFLIGKQLGLYPHFLYESGTHYHTGLDLFQGDSVLGTRRITPPDTIGVTAPISISFGPDLIVQEYRRPFSGS